MGVPVLLGVRPVEGRVPLLLGLRSESERTAVADRVAAALRAGVERAGPRAAGRAAAGGGRRAWRAAGRRPRRACATRRRRRRRPRGCRTGPGTTPAAWTSTCCCGGCATTRTWRPSWTARSARSATTTAAPGRRCCPPWRPIWPTRAARRRRPANCTSTARPCTTAWPASANCWARDLDDPQTVLALSLALRARRHTLWAPGRAPARLTAQGGPAGLEEATRRTPSGPATAQAPVTGSSARPVAPQSPATRQPKKRGVQPLAPAPRRRPRHAAPRGLSAGASRGKVPSTRRRRSGPGRRSRPRVGQVAACARPAAASDSPPRRGPPRRRTTASASASASPCGTNSAASPTSSRYAAGRGRDERHSARGALPGRAGSADSPRLGSSARSAAASRSPTSSRRPRSRTGSSSSSMRRWSSARSRPLPRDHDQRHGVEPAPRARGVQQQVVAAVRVEGADGHQQRAVRSRPVRPAPCGLRPRGLPRRPGRGSATAASRASRAPGPAGPVDEGGGGAEHHGGRLRHPPLQQPQHMARGRPRRAPGCAR